MELVDGGDPSCVREAETVVDKLEAAASTGALTVVPGSEKGLGA